LFCLWLLSLIISSNGFTDIVIVAIRRLWVVVVVVNLGLLGLSKQLLLHLL